MRGTTDQPVYPILNLLVRSLLAGTLVQVHDVTYDMDIQYLDGGPLPPSIFEVPHGRERWVFPSDVGTVVSATTTARRHNRLYGLFSNGCEVFYDHDGSPNRYDFYVFQEAPR